MCISNIGTIELKGMQFFAYHGVFPEEREKGNDFVVDLCCKYDISAAMGSDNLADTLNYAAVYNLISEQMAIPSNLLEHVAGRIASEIEREFPEILHFSISIAKQNPPVQGKVECSRITVIGGSEE